MQLIESAEKRIGFLVLTSCSERGKVCHCYCFWCDRKTGYPRQHCTHIFAMRTQVFLYSLTKYLYLQLMVSLMCLPLKTVPNLEAAIDGLIQGGYLPTGTPCPRWRLASLLIYYSDLVLFNKISNLVDWFACPWPLNRILISYDIHNSTTAGVDVQQTFCLILFVKRRVPSSTSHECRYVWCFYFSQMSFPWIGF